MTLVPKPMDLIRADEVIMVRVDHEADNAEMFRLLDESGFPFFIPRSDAIVFEPEIRVRGRSYKGLPQIRAFLSEAESAA